MSGFFDLERLNQAVVPDCPLFVIAPGSFLAVALDFHPLILSFGAVIWSFVKQREALALALSVLLWLDWGVSALLTTVVDEPARFAACGCGHQAASPSFSSQHITVFVVAVMLFVSVFGAGLSVSTTFVLTLFQQGALVSRVYIGSNTTSQLTLGTTVGVVEGVVLALVLNYTLVAAVLKLIRSNLGRRVQIRDSYLLPCVYVMRRREDEFSVPDAVAHELDALRHRRTGTELPAEL